LLHDLYFLVISALKNRHRVILLSHLAMIDHLTGLANRAQFERTLNSEMAHSRRTSEPCTVLYMDLDDFKELNDYLGHAASDEVLCETARCMADQVRTEDLLARIGGDEFGVFMRQSVEDSPESLAKHIVKVVSAPIYPFHWQHKVNVGILVDIATYTNTMDSMFNLLAQTNHALYEAKKKI
jgi:diguanylate cyclase (GGDEF)-like protein